VTTRLLRVDESPSAITDAAQVLRSGGLVAFPTETVYGLGADAFNERAVGSLFEAKGRPMDNPLIVHIADFFQAVELAADVPPLARELAAYFWPGPLTLVLSHNGKIPPVVTAGLPTVAVRMPDHKVALDLIRECGGGIVGPSANTSGKPSPTRAEHVLDDLNGKIDIILDAGPTKKGIESTIVDVTVDPPVILRLGSLPQSVIEDHIGKILLTEDDSFLRRAPGTRYRHYSPRAEVVLLNEADAATLETLIESELAAGKRVGCLLHSLEHAEGKNLRVIRLNGIEAISRMLYDAFRRLDEWQSNIIIVESTDDPELGPTVMDRLRRAAGYSGVPSPTAK
jgi:L-threonylcarbamoyladenylate synthase